MGHLGVVLGPLEGFLAHLELSWKRLEAVLERSRSFLRGLWLRKIAGVTPTRSPLRSQNQLKSYPNIDPFVDASKDLLFGQIVVDFECKKIRKLKLN